MLIPAGPRTPSLSLLHLAWHFKAGDYCCGERVTARVEQGMGPIGEQLDHGLSGVKVSFQISRV